MQAYRMYRPAYPMSRFLLLSILLSTLIGAPGMALELLLDDSDQLSINMPLPTVLTNQADTHVDDPQLWLKQDFSLANYQSSFHAGPHASWHKIELLGKFNDARPREKILAVNAHTLQHLSFYLFDDHKLITFKAVGLSDAHPQPLNYYHPHLRFHIKDGQRLTLIIGKLSDGPALLPMKIYGTAQYALGLRQQNMFWGAVIAVLLALALYNVLVYAMHPNRTYLWYLAFHGAAFLYFAAVNGFGFWLWPSGLQIMLVQNIPLLSFIILFLLVNFSNRFLEAKQHASNHHKYVPWYSAVSIVGGISSLFVAGYTMLPLFAFFQLLVSIFILSMGYRALKNKFYPARYFLLSWALTITGGAISTCTYINLIPASFFNLHSFLFGTMAELFLLSVAMAARIKYMEQKLLSKSYMQPNTQAANFSYLKQFLPSCLPKLLATHGQLAIFVANVKGYREVVSLYGPSAMGNIYRYFTARSSNFLATQQWSVALPLPTENRVHMVILPGAQIFLLLKVDKSSEINYLKNIAESLFGEFEKTISISDMRVNLRFEMGYSFIDRAADLPESYRQAQTALLNAPRQNKKFLRYNPNQDAVISERLSLMHELKSAINDETLQIYIQPQFNLKNQRLNSGEILIRWSHPHRGNINPGLFIPLAEKSGMIYPITRLVIKNTCRWLQQLKLTHEKWLKDFTVSINLSALDMTQPDLLPYLQHCLKQYGVAAKNIMLEITESAVMDHPQEFLNTVQQLKEAGFSISIDDFGTGYSSMMYLQTIQAAEIKIDLAFIRDIHLDETKQKIVKAIIKLAHSTHAHTVAEGVECQEEADYLASINCHIAQGYLWSPAIPLQQFEASYLASKNIHHAPL